MWKNDSEVYREVLKARALDYLKNYSNLSITEYLEFHGGPVLGAFMRMFSPSRVINDLELEVSNQR